MLFVRSGVISGEGGVLCYRLSDEAAEQEAGIINPELGEQPCQRLTRDDNKRPRIESEALWGVLSRAVVWNCHGDFQSLLYRLSYLGNGAH